MIIIRKTRNYINNYFDKKSASSFRFRVGNENEKENERNYSSWNKTDKYRNLMIKMIKYAGSY